MNFCHYPKFTIVQTDQLYLVEADANWVILKGAKLAKINYAKWGITDHYF